MGSALPFPTLPDPHPGSAIAVLGGDDTLNPTGVRETRHQGLGLRSPNPQPAPQEEGELCPLGGARRLGWLEAAARTER